jgi:site-specific DNA-cytosine methylase
VTTHEFTAGFLFAGSGVGARGFLEALAQLRGIGAKFRNLGGVDNDPLACADFEYLSGAPCACADVSTMQPADLRAAWGPRRPDAVFLSPPCKGFSGLLSKASAAKPHYQALNRLVLQGLHLVCSTWNEPPPLIVLENVPRIASRGADLLEHARDVLRASGYVFHEGFHDCGEIGGLAQHRRRFLMVARRPESVPAFVYQPPKLRVRACGEVLGPLPLPEDPSAGELHRLPRLSWINWVRLALIPAGGDWRDLPRSGVASAPLTDRPSRHRNQYKITDWTEAAGTVIGATRPGSGGASVADPRVALGRTAAGAGSFKGRPGLMGVNAWNEPAPCVAGTMHAAAGSVPASVADPRLPVGKAATARGGALGVQCWGAPSATVTGSANHNSSNMPACVADPRVGLPDAETRYSNKYKVREWQAPAGTVTGDTDVQEGSQSIGDPRVGLAHKPRAGSFGVTDWEAPAPTVRGVAKHQNGGAAVSDPRVPLTCTPRERSGAYGVIGWDSPAATVTGSANIDNGPFGVADPRLPPGYRRFTVEEALAAADHAKSPPAGVVPVIASQHDGTWHRPLTTLELAALQGLPAEVAGAPLKLAGKSVSGWRERIGNAVPVGAGRAIAEALLQALLAAALGTWTLGSTGIWVRRREAVRVGRDLR